MNCLQYVATYVPKFSDSFANDWLNDEASDFSWVHFTGNSAHPKHRFMCTACREDVVKGRKVAPTAMLAACTFLSSHEPHRLLRCLRQRLVQRRSASEMEKDALSVRATLALIESWACKAKPPISAWLTGYCSATNMPSEQRQRRGISPPANTRPALGPPEPLTRQRRP